MTPDEELIKVSLDEKLLYAAAKREIKEEEILMPKMIIDLLHNPIKGINIQETVW